VPFLPSTSRRRFVFLCGLLPVLVIAVLAALRPASLARLDDAVYDVLLRSARTPGPGGTVAIVDVDEPSLSAFGQWPWRRDVVGRLIDRLRAEGASIIALDIMFPEPDRQGPAADHALAEALRGGRVILGYGLTFDKAPRAPVPCVLHPIGLALIRPPGETSDQALFHAAGAVCNLPALGESVAASGFLNAAPDADGILRRVPLVAQLDGRVYPGLALAAVSATTGARDLALRIINVNAAELAVGDRTVPVDGRGNLLLRYRGKKNTFPYYSAADVLAQQLPAGALRGKIVFVGTTALGTREVVATPLDTLFAGVEVQATVADNLLQQDFIRRPALGTTLESLVVLVLGVAMAALVARIGVGPGLAGAAVTVAALWWGAVWLLQTDGVFISPLSSTSAIVGAVAAMTLAKVAVERGRADNASREKTTAQRLMVQALLSLTEVRDAETGRHSRRTQQYARLLAEQLATQPEFRNYLTRERIDLLSSLAPLHDIGKVGVRDHVLTKPGALTPAEQVEMRKHPELGRDVILKAEARVGVRDDATLDMAKDIVYTHHERWDGAGYPQGLSGAAIPVAGRVMALVDVYDAAHARTLYRQCMSHDETVAFILKGKGTHFDPAVVDAFLTVASRFKSTSEEPIPEPQ
jgi:HD-GYP domain-containing protein (c-di-GMP phosphodiesterase class II)